MKKITFQFLFTIFTVGISFGQVTNVINAPIFDNSTTTARAPNGSSAHSFMRASALVLTSELTAIPSGTSLTSFGLVTNSGANVAVAGTLTVYMKNSSDATFTLGTNWATIISGMTQVYSSTFTVPASATNIDLTLSTPFTYTGGSVYVAYDFVRSGTAATTAAVYMANSTGLTGGCVSAANAASAPTTLASTNFRPVMRFGFPNLNSNDMSVDGVSSFGNVATAIGTPVPIAAIVTNKSNTGLTNISVSANMTGVNTYTNTQTIASLAAGASTTVNFASWTPTALGSNVLNISVPADQVNTNNSFNFNTTTTCFTSGAAQNPATYPNPIGFNTGSGIISTPVQNTVATTISGVNVAISSNAASVGNNVFGVLLNNSGTILAQSPNVTIANGDLSTIKTFTFPSAVAVAANQIVHVGLGQTANATTGYFPVGSYTNASLTTVYNTCTLTGGALSPTTNLGQMGIEANFNGTCTLGLEDVDFSNGKLVVYPNPANTVLNIKLGSFSNSVTVEVFNTLGQQVLPAQKVVKDTFEVNVSSLTKGIYFLKVTNDKETSKVKFAVER